MARLNPIPLPTEPREAADPVGLLGPLRVELLPDGRRVRLIQPYRVRIEGPPQRIVEVPRGFESDFASVPRLFWRIVPPWGRYAPAAVVHDYLYATGRLSRSESDRAFLKLMQRLGVPAWKRRLMYRAVRMFGGRPWKEARAWTS